VSDSSERRRFLRIERFLVVVRGFEVEIKGFNGFGAESVDDVLYFFDDKSDIFILLIRHDGSLDFLDLI
jgi:hypothetical protein